MQAWGYYADFACIYIQEAHAVDEWPINQLDTGLAQHACLEARRAAAQAFLQHLRLQSRELAMPVWVDDMSNAFNACFASWPFRFWVLARQRPVHEGVCSSDGGAEVRVAFKAMPHSCVYELDDVDGFLRGHCVST